MKEYSEFITNLEDVVKGFSSQPFAEWRATASKFVNGLASEQLRNLVPLDTRRTSGAFFTSDEMALDVLESYKQTFGKKKAIFYDPACGAGNLLIAVKEYYSQHLKCKGITLEVRGTDIHREFVEATRLRLSIYRLNKGLQENNTELEVKIADGLKENPFYKEATHIITNPPFNQISPVDKKKWGSGKISAAALFIDHIVEQVNPGTQILAILPDVLRSGSRYNHWREHISSKSNISGIKLLGQFDKFADIDVFSVLITKLQDQQKKSGISEWGTEKAGTSVISDHFNICVGPVVDNRDEKVGPVRPYFVSRGLVGWTEVSESSYSRAHKGRHFTSPFVVIKRTSRRGDSNRAIGTIVNASEPVFIDNHLIILQPKSGKINDCKRLLRILKSEKTDSWIDEKIRCRHLTVKVISNIPL